MLKSEFYRCKVLDPYSAKKRILTTDFQANRILNISGVDQLQKLEEFYVADNGLENAKVDSIYNYGTPCSA